MVGVNKKEEYTLAEIQNILKVEQHRLIHLCEKGVIVPDFEDASGRGTMRRFSEKNLFEFSVSLEFRHYYLPIHYIKPIIKILRTFEGYARKKIEVFNLPGSLQNKSAIILKIIITEGKYLYFSLGKGKTNIFIGRIDLSFNGKQSFDNVKTTTDNPALVSRSCLEIDLNKIAARII